MSHLNNVLFGWELVIDLQETGLMRKVFNQDRHLLSKPERHKHYSIFLSAAPGKLNSKESGIKKE